MGGGISSPPSSASNSRLWKGLTVTSAYTYGKMIDTGAAGQNMYDRRPERGLSDSDIRHNFIAGFVDDLPVAICR